MVYQILAAVLASVLYIPLSKLIRAEATKQNIATWALWVILDVIAGISLYNQGGNWLLLVPYVVGGSYVTIRLFKSGKWKWGWMETATMLMVFISIYMWSRSGPWWATVLATIGVVIGGIPQLVDAYSEPKHMPLKIYLGFWVVNILATIGGADWSMKERLYPASCVVLVGTITLVTFMRRENQFFREINRMYEEI